MNFHKKNIRLYFLKSIYLIVILSSCKIFSNDKENFISAKNLYIKSFDTDQGNDKAEDNLTEIKNLLFKSRN